MLATISLNTCIDRVLTAKGFAVGMHAPVTLTSETPAGKGVNVARILVALACPVTLFGFVGKDAADSLAAGLRGLPITNRIHTLPIRTRINTTIIDTCANTETHLRERGATIDEAEVTRLGEQIATAMSPGDWLIFSGSLPPGISADTLGGVIRDLVAKDFRVAADITSDGLVAAVAAGVTLIKPNRNELTALVGEILPSEAGLLTAARQVLAKHEGLSLLVSDGAAGAILVSADGAWRACTPDAVSVVSTVGAGDALLAGYLSAREQADPPPECLRCAVQVATASLGCSRSGMVAPGHQDIPVNVVALSATAG